MKLSCLSSGSSGNCFYIENNGKAILVDAGISAKSVSERLSLLNESPEKIKAIFITHEHTDHIAGADVLARNFQIPIFASRGTLKNSFVCSDENLINEIKTSETFSIAGMEISSFLKSHDASEPISFQIKNGKTISVLTDIGSPCKNVSDAITDSDFLIMESNHDEEMLSNGPYPYFLKKRIASDKGHLSNRQAGLCVLEHSSPKLKHIILAHLSETNNNPSLALKTFNSLIKERINVHPKVSLSSRFSPTPLFAL